MYMYVAVFFEPMDAPTTTIVIFKRILENQVDSQASSEVFPFVSQYTHTLRYSVYFPYIYTSIYCTYIYSSKKK